MEEQFKALKKDQAAHAASIRRLEFACQDEPRLNVNHWMQRLAGEDASLLIEEIEAEKKRLRGLDATPTKEEAVSATKSVEAYAEITRIGIPEGLDLRSDFPGVNKTMRIEISYPVDLAEALSELFKSLKQYGIKIKSVREEEYVV
jgi:hypothetical protein